MKKKRLFIIAGVVLLACITSCITIYVQKDNVNSQINTSDTSENSADSASVNVDIPADVLN